MNPKPYGIDELLRYAILAFCDCELFTLRLGSNPGSATIWVLPHVPLVFSLSCVLP